MSEMVERVAAALRHERRRIGGPLAVMLTPECEARLSRAAIEAMREPTAAMLAAFDRQMAKRTNPRLAYRGMIDTALATTPPATR